jgi:hypothetical protein
MSNLISRTRALANLAGQSLTAADIVTLDNLIPAASRAIEAYCGRSFGLANFDERYDGRRHPTLWLRQYPVTAIERIAFAPTVVLRVQNETAMQAQVQVSDVGLALVRVSSGVTAVDRVDFASAATLGDLVTAIGAIGHGWTASLIRTGDAGRASADLAAFPGSFAACTAAAELRLHAESLSTFDLDNRLGSVRRVDRHLWCGGPCYWRVLYTAGYEEVPDDVQEACAELVAQLFFQTKRDPGLLEETLRAALSRRPREGMLPLVRDLLAPHCRFLAE